MGLEGRGLPWALWIRGRLDRPRFQAAIQRACDRHEARRAGYEPSFENGFTRYVEAKARPNFTWRVMRGASLDEQRHVIREWFVADRGLSPPNLSRFLVIQLADEEFVFANFFHHATNDGTTHAALLREIFEIYSGRDPPEPPGQYGDVWDWDWTATPAYAEAEAFWIDRLAAVQDLGELAEDGGDLEEDAWVGPVSVRLPAELTKAARRAAEACGVSEFTFYYAAVLVQLSRLTGRNRVASTFQSEGRRGVPGSTGVHGVFSNALIVATEVDEDGSIASLAQILRGEIRAALAHEAFPYHHIVRATGVLPRFGINWFPELPSFEADGLEISKPEMSFGTFDYDLNVRFVRIADTREMDLLIFFREGAFQRRRIAAIAEQFVALLGGLSRDVDAPISATSSAELAPPGVLPDPNATLTSETGQPIHTAFLRRAQETPEAPALISDSVWTYGELERRSRAIARGLHDAGVRPGDRVAILAERDPGLVGAILGAARAGAVFTVLDSAHPQPRLAELAGAFAPMVVVAAGAAGLSDAARWLADRTAASFLDTGTFDEDPEWIEAEAPAPSDPAYVLFTSGSTGRPKAILCPHGPLAHFVDWQARTFGLTAADRFTCLSGLGHDPLLRDLFTPLSIGAAVSIPTSRSIIEPGVLARWMRTSDVTVSHLTPAMGRVLMAGAEATGGFPALRRIFWGGDRLPGAGGAVRDARPQCRTGQLLRLDRDAPGGRLACLQRRRRRPDRADRPRRRRLATPRAERSGRPGGCRRAGRTRGAFGTPRYGVSDGWSPGAVRQALSHRRPGVLPSGRGRPFRRACGRPDQGAGVPRRTRGGYRRAWRLHGRRRRGGAGRR